jgi:hypothetical protein
MCRNDPSRLSFVSFGDLSASLVAAGFASAKKLIKWGVEFKTQQEVVFIRGYIAYDRLVRARRPARNGR